VLFGEALQIGDRDGAGVEVVALAWSMSAPGGGALFVTIGSTFGSKNIFFDRSTPARSRSRGVLEQIVAAAGRRAATLSRASATPAVCDSTTAYNNLTARKFRAKARAGFCRRREDRGAARRGLRHAPGESLDALLARLQPMFFDPNVDPIVTNKAPPPGADMLQASANNSTPAPSRSPI